MTPETRLRDTTQPEQQAGPEGEVSIELESVNILCTAYEQSGKAFMQVYALVAGFKPDILPRLEPTFSCDVVTNPAKSIYDAAAKQLGKKSVEGVFVLPDKENFK